MIVVYSTSSGGATTFWSDEVGKVEHVIQNCMLDFILQQPSFGSSHIRFTGMNLSTCKPLAVRMLT